MMGAQRLGSRRLRQIERLIGEPVLRGWSHGGYTLGFVTPDHRHGWWDKKSDAWGWYDVDDRFVHYSSCKEFEGDGAA
jgi:hypothetical protein